MKILITGNPDYGIANSLKEILGPDHELTFVSRTANNINLTTALGVFKLVQLSIDCDIFINNSCLTNFAQTTVYDEVWNNWKASGKSGFIINIGSSAEKIVNRSWKYSSEKAALKRASEQGAFQSAWGKSNIRVTYISMGHVSTPYVRNRDPNLKKHTMDEVANLIKWVIEYPSYTNIDELSVCPIQ